MKQQYFPKYIWKNFQFYQMLKAVFIVDSN